MSEQNNIPKHWQIKKLGEVCEKIEKVKRKEKNPDEELIYLDIGGIDNNTNKILYHKNYQWKDAPSRAQQIVSLNDILFSTVRTYMKNIAMVENKIYEGQFASSGFCVIRANEKIVLSKYIFYYSISQIFLHPLNELQTGTSYPAVRDKDIFCQPIPIPPLPEQLAIVSKIEELLSDLDNGKQQLLTAQQQQKVYRQSLLKAAFEGRLTNDDVKDGELPKGWIWVKLGDVIEKIEAGKSFKCDERTPNINEVGVLKVSSVTWQIFNELESKTVIDKDKINANYMVKKGDFLFSRANTLDLIGAVVLVNKIDRQLMLSDKTLRFSFNNQVVKPYVLYYLRSKKGRHEIQILSTGNQESMRNIGQERIKQIEFPLPSLEQQKEIIEILESKLTVCDKIEETISQSLQQAETLRQSILKKAFEGRLV